ncbi:uncharacterized protein EDB93DRAFT_1181059 [Suillus bovinus]|uniref:uncharacterized protein n=1 Tax=Suillus bovinus TaxID=48563 RepID=UPI001B8749EE|nr:uncharacterized protein EDB93DRAFT_1181059 [Suillus bovinus]KAG2130165.1 hypothetical protein EDB93DRAFT_1181059 [Suillus bovinus]
MNEDVFNSRRRSSRLQSPLQVEAAVSDATAVGETFATPRSNTRQLLQRVKKGVTRKFSAVKLEGASLSPHPELQDEHSVVEEDAVPQPIVAHVHHTLSCVDEGAGLQSVATQVHNITSGIEERTSLQLVGVERRAADEAADHMNILGMPHTEIELPSLDQFTSQHHNVSTLPATSCSTQSTKTISSDSLSYPHLLDEMDKDARSASQAHSLKGDQILQTDKPPVSEDADDDVYLSAKSDNGEDSTDAEDSLLDNDVRDLVQSIKSMYRVLDLVSERGSGGLVDKIIIAQDSLRTFINAICPGAYVSMTNVDFSALDSLIMKPIGIYGSKEEIVRLLLALGVVDDHIAAQLVANHSESSVSKPNLRSGLYIVRTNCEATSDEQVFVVYWPEDATWDDSAPSSVKRTRVTFMRYLTTICDQVKALISPEHARSIVWCEQEGENTMEMDENQDEHDRMFTFEVRKTNEQEEAIKPRPGFKAASSHIAMPQAHSEVTGNVGPHKPWLLHGETTQGFMTSSYLPARRITDKWTRKSITRLQLSNWLCTDSLRINENLDVNALHLLLDAGLRDRFPQLCNEWQQESANISSNVYACSTATQAGTRKKLEDNSSLLTPIFHWALVDAIIQKFPTFTYDSFPYSTKDEQGCYATQGPIKPATAPSSSSPHFMESVQHSFEVQDQLSTIVELYPEIGDELRHTVQKLSIEKINSRDFKSYKERIYVAQSLLRQFPDVKMEDEDFSNAILHKDIRHVRESVRMIGRSAAPHQRPKGLMSTTLNSINFFISSGEGSQFVDKTFNDAEAAASATSDTQFLAELDDIEKLPVMKKVVACTRAAALAHFRSLLMMQTTILTHSALHIQISKCVARVRQEALSSEDQQLAQSRKRLIASFNAHSEMGFHSHTSLINAIEDGRGFLSLAASSVQITGSREYLEQPKLKFTVHPMELTAQDLHSLQLDSSTIPSPKFRNSFTFKLPLGHSVVRAQLLPGEKILLATTDLSGNLTVYLEHLTAIEGALAHGSHGKKLNSNKIGKFVLAFDESKRVLSVVATEKLLLHIFIHDDNRVGFQANGSAINLTQWYPEGTSIKHACFIYGGEELLLVDTLAQARVYSLTTMQFRPATLNLIQIPTAVYSTPDGSCLIVSHVRGSDLTLTAHHWSTFGSTDGILLEIPDLPLDQPLLLTSLTSRNIVHLVTLDIDTRLCRSIALDITRRATEFTFKERGTRAGNTKSGNITAHNCLIDCHAEVWTRFPVLSAIQRETITSSSQRCQRTLVFITGQDYHRFVPHFHDLISTFERTSKKPTGNLLKRIDVSSTAYSAFHDSHLGGVEWSVSKFRAGEWLAEFLCLIPIQIAVTMENRFIPLKDGVYSTQLEKSLLGADVNRIVDHLSFGWYESLFQSYMAKKPVKVVSSMGEQSVGKSFSLNHLMDTSFAGSAMRTTEGVWMSVTPTQDVLVVALDFEGVHSIERSAQEDTLLVLFNTAISNLVLFRNNFALSRDITGLFQSFQSSATVLDPATNPNLFQSTLVIIIKRMLKFTLRFALKFQKIVQDEQEANFISRLHAGQLNIIPWPVIESQEFYKLFPALKRQLDKQKLTHSTAGEFLHVMKTLMAKLKANDWGALSQSMASHRAQLLSVMLPNALAFGLQEVDPCPEPLKNLDDGVPIDMPDTASEFSLAGGQQSSSREAALHVLSCAWKDHTSRQHMSDVLWVENLTAHIDNLINLRVAHVRKWILLNVTRFPSEQASIGELMRTFGSATIDLKSNLQLCKLKCASCELLCIQSRLHDGQHDCQTSHECIHSCDFCASSGETKACTMSCIVNAHLCGQVCKLFGRQGCLDECTKVIGHVEDDHLCAATVHACGQSCELSKLRLADGSTPPCRGICGTPIDVDHDQHHCGARLCSFPCQLCKRLCASTNHLHGLQDGAIHLCGNTHVPWIALPDGICEIETAPQSIEATFTGRHETFQYTKVAWLAKRLRCAKPIPPGLAVHEGQHNHSLDERVVHFCRARCEHCGYYCTLPLGHPQQEHETRHGSMSSSRWAIDGPDGTSLEVEGRRFSSNDEGAPMMCNIVCQTLGRHVHIDYCRSQDAAPCRLNPEVLHISKRMSPTPDRPKDFLTHNLFWRRSGFKDPYSREERANFAKCDAMCSGPEHTIAEGNAAQPSFCTLPLFHVPMDPNAPLTTLGYISNDGHFFSCRNPVVMQQAFHVSSSMRSTDRQPLRSTPVSDKIIRSSNNRFGAVLSSLYGFWSARAAAVAGQQAARRDSYSVILFDQSTVDAVFNDFSSSPDDLLDAVLRYQTSIGTNFTAAIQRAQLLMEHYWSTERTPVIIFLSDGECPIEDQTIQDLCRAAVRLGKPLSFHSVSFGQNIYSSSLRRMFQIALEAQNNAPRDPFASAAATVASTYSEALDTVQLAETFLGIAHSLTKPRGFLISEKET